MRPRDSDPLDGYLTPDEPSDDLLCRSFSIPNDTRWLGNFMGALLPLTDPNAWRQFGTLTPEEAAAAYAQIIEDGLPGQLNQCPSDDVPAPYWDDAEDSDDVLPPTEQDWYGMYDGDFLATLTDWAIAGFIAYSGSIQGAIAFLTIAPQFRLAWKTGDVGGIIRIFIDTADQGTVDTYSASPGVLEKDFFGDPELEEHQIIMVLEELHA